MADLVDAIKGLGGKRQKVLDAAEREATGVRTPPPPTALTPSKPVATGSEEQTKAVLSEAQQKAARFKWELENPGKPYSPPKMAHGGLVHGKGGPTDDQEVIAVSPGEFVVPADTVKRIGLRNLQAMVESTHMPSGKPMMKNGMRAAADGFDPYAEYGPEIPNQPGKGEVKFADRAKAGVKSAGDSVRSFMGRFRRSGPSPESLKPGGPGLVSVDGGPLQAPVDPVKGIVGKGMRVVGKAAPYVGAALEGANTYADVTTPGVDNTMKVARAAEGVSRIAGTTAGGLVGAGLGTAAFPGIGTGIGGVLGGAAGYFAPDAAAALANKLIGDDGDLSLPSDRIAGIRNAQPPAPPKYVPQGTPATGDFTDQNDRKLMQGKVLPPQNDTTTRQKDPYSADLPDGTGVIGNGVRQMTVNAPGKPDTIAAANAAARAEMQAMDERNRATFDANEQAHDTALRNMRNQGERAQASYELDQARSEAKRFPRDPGVVRNLAIAQQRDAAARGLDAKEAETNANNRTELAKNKAFTDAMKNRDAVGLRQAQYTADKSLEAHKYTADANMASNVFKAKFDMMQKSLEQEGENRNAREKWLQQRFTTPTVDPKTGQVTGNVFNKAESDAFLKEVVTKAASSPNFLSQFKNQYGQPVTKVDELTPTQLDQIHQDYKKSAQLTANANATADSGDDQLHGAPQGLRVRPTKAGDFYDPAYGPEQNSISLGQSLWGSTFARDPLASHTISVVGSDGKVQNRILGDVVKTPEDAARVADLLEKTDPKMAAKIRQTFNPQVKGIR